MKVVRAADHRWSRQGSARARPVSRYGYGGYASRRPAGRRLPGSIEGYESDPQGQGPGSGAGRLSGKPLGEPASGAVSRATTRIRPSWLGLEERWSAARGNREAPASPRSGLNQSTRCGFEAATCSRLYDLGYLIGLDAFRESPLTSMTQMEIFRASFSDSIAVSCRSSSQGFPGRMLEGWGCVYLLPNQKGSPHETEIIVR